jgi:intermediate cleaving peptidase 55
MHDFRVGQPIYETHPHLLKAGEITQGISAIEYATRRAKLASQLPEHGIAILGSADLKYRSDAVFYEYRQDSDFLYLTGFLEPDAIAVIEKTGPDGQHRFHLFARPSDAKAELWEGQRSGLQSALDIFNADESGDITDFSKLLSKLVTEESELFLNPSQKSRQSSILTRLWTQGQELSETLKRISAGHRLKPLRPILNELRSVKSTAEVVNMRWAGRLSGRAITAAMKEEFDTEKDLWAFLEYKFKTAGCDGPAYVPVVAGGQNALTIHYVRNDCVLGDGDLVLVDAGGEYGGYVTDITRTWPVNGTFTPPQRDLYEALLKVQRSCISLCRADAMLSLDQIHGVAERALKDQLKDLGFDTSDESIRTLFPHHVGHHVGLDVHDCPGFSRTEKLKPGNCITIEPGVYVPIDDRWPKHFQGIGIRIEDSVCVQEETPLILTTEAVKEIVDIEALRR